jgi:Zn-finger protein
VIKLAFINIKIKSNYINRAELCEYFYNKSKIYNIVILYLYFYTFENTIWTKDRVNSKNATFLWPTNQLLSIKNQLVGNSMIKILMRCLKAEDLNTQPILNSPKAHSLSPLVASM